MSQLIPIAEGLAPIAAGVGLIALFGRDPKADQHDLSDYHEPAPINTEPASLRRYEQLDQQQPATPELCASPDCPACDDGELPPAPPGTNAGGSPIYASLVAERVVDEQLQKWGATTTERADRILRELGDKAQMEATA